MIALIVAVSTFLVLQFGSSLLTRNIDVNYSVSAATVGERIDESLDSYQVRSASWFMSERNGPSLLVVLTKTTGVAWQGPAVYEVRNDGLSGVQLELDTDLTFKLLLEVGSYIPYQMGVKHFQGAENDYGFFPPLTLIEVGAPWWRTWFANREVTVKAGVFNFEMAPRHPFQYDDITMGWIFCALMMGYLFFIPRLK